MNERTKKIIVLVLFVLSVFAIGAGLYFAFLRPTAPAPTVTVPGEDLPTGILPTSIEGAPDVTTPGAPDAPGLSTADEIARGGVTQITTLTTSRIEQATRSTDGQGANFYNPDDGRFYTIDEEGNVVQLSSKIFPDAENVEWNKDADKAVIEFPDGSNIIYDFGAETQVTLPQHWQDFNFSPVQDKIIAKSIGIDPNNRWLVITNDDGSNVQAIAALGLNENKVVVSWSPNDQVVAFADTAEQISGGFDRKMIIPIGKNEENYKGLTVEGLGFDSKWSPDGKKLLYSVFGDYSDNKPLLWIVDATPGTMGENRSSLGLNTWVDKCTFHTSTKVYCAVPVNLSVNSGVQRRLSASNPDHVYELDLTNGRSNRVAIPETSTVMTNLTVSVDGSLLYYTNAITGRLELIRLR